MNIIEKEIEVKDYLTKSNLPASDYVINPYVGCPHGCKYCYASFMKRFTGHKEEWDTFIDVKRCTKLISKKKLKGTTVFLASVTDCYNSYEEKYCISYTADFLSKRRVINDGSVQMYHIEEDHEPIIDIENWEAVQAEIERRVQYCADHFTNAYSQKSETNPFYAKIICGNCGNIYSRVKYTTKAGIKITKWRCGSCNKTNGHKVCSNRYVTDETFTKLFIMGWNEITEHPEDYQEKWNANIKSDDVLLRYKTRLLMKHVEAGTIKEFDSALMMAVMDHITVYEDGRLKIRFYDETEFEVTTE